MNAPRITREQIEALRLRIVYKFHRPEGTTSTFCHAFLPNDKGGLFYLATGHSACVSIENFNEDIGRDIASSKAVQQSADKLWELEGYSLYKKLSKELANV